MYIYRVSAPQYTGHVEVVAAGTKTAAVKFAAKEFGMPQSAMYATRYALDKMLWIGIDTIAGGADQCPAGCHVEIDGAKEWFVGTAKAWASYYAAFIAASGVAAMRVWRE